MKNQLILKTTNKSLPSENVREAFIRKIPKERILEELKLEFKRNGIKSPDEAISIIDIANAIINVSEWINKNLIDGMFLHKLNINIDKINDFIYWQYEIQIKNAMMSFEITSDIFDPYTEMDLTPKIFLEYLNKKFIKGNKRINRFNEIVNTVKPKLPNNLPKYNIVNEIMENVERHMTPESNSNHLGNLSDTLYDTWIIGDALKDVKRYKLTKNGSALIEYDVFNKPNEGWIIIEGKLRLKGIGVRFLLNKREVNYYDEMFGDEINDFYMNFVDSMEMAIQNWNWLVNGGNNKKSKVKNSKFIKTGR